MAEYRYGFQSDLKVDIESFFCDLRNTVTEGIIEEKIATLNTFAAKVAEIIDEQIDMEQRQAKLYNNDDDTVGYIVETLETVKEAVESVRWTTETRIQNENTYR